MTSYKKHKSPSKTILPHGQDLTSQVLATMREISAIVGSTLGPGGRQVLLERDEEGVPPFVTKDGVTVYRALGYDNAISHAIVEIARDASVRTASEAGDGTTTATVLSEALVRYTHEYLKTQGHIAPQRLVRRLQAQVPALIEAIDGIATPVASDTPEGQQLMRTIAATSANGDTELANAVIEAFEASGDEGNVTLVEASGPSGYAVEPISGFPIGVGYEDSCGRFTASFINDKVNQRIVLDDPVFLLYNGKITDFALLLPALETISHHYAIATKFQFNKNVVVIATGFSDAVLGHMATITLNESAINCIPLLAPLSPVINGQSDWYEDLATVTGARVLSPVGKGLDQASIETDIGPLVYKDEESGDQTYRIVGVKHFECGRFRSLLLGVPEDGVIGEGRLSRSDALRARLSQEGVSELDKRIIEERVAKLTDSIARLKVYGSSNGEVKEKRDRAEDAVCAVRGALKHGALPGGAWTLVYLAQLLREQMAEDTPEVQVLARACEEPFLRLMENAGFTVEETGSALGALRDNADFMRANGDESMASAVCFNLQEFSTGSAFDAGVVDAVPAVREALRNAVSIATLLGTLGGAVVYPRDAAFERREAGASKDFLRAVRRGETEE